MMDPNGLTCKRLLHNLIVPEVTGMKSERQQVVGRFSLASITLVNISLFPSHSSTLFWLLWLGSSLVFKIHSRFFSCVNNSWRRYSPGHILWCPARPTLRVVQVLGPDDQAGAAEQADAGNRHLLEELGEEMTLNADSPFELVFYLPALSYLS